jgi:hypothetical protein
MVLAIAVGTVVLWVAQRAGSDAGQTGSAVPASWRRPVVSADGLAERSGAKITLVSVTGDGGLVDLRFKILDPQRANAMHDQGRPPAVVDEQSGLVVHELLMNHSHTGQYQTGVTYYLIFTNPGNWIHRGSRVTVLLGNAQVEHVLVK